MAEQSNFIDIAHNSLNKRTESLCGDKVQVYKSEDRTIIVLADGLGSGVKANILATLTSQIMITMLRLRAGIFDVVDTVMHTLPVCSVRKIAYSTFTIVEIDKDMNCQIYEYDNPSFFFIRNGQVVDVDKQTVTICDKEVTLSKFKLREDDLLYVCSDGVVHAGVGTYLSFGWEWDNVAKYLLRQKASTAYSLCNKLLDACNSLYEGCPDDDTTVVAVKIRPAQLLQVFTGPPANPAQDAAFVKYFDGLRGKKMISGGTAAQIYAHQNGLSLYTDLDYVDTEVPVTAHIDGVNLVTEGVVTMSRCAKLLRGFKQNHKSVDLTKQDGATRMMKLFLEDSTNIKIWFGKAVNGAHQEAGFPVDLSFKINVVKELIDALQDLGKDATLEYISEIRYERV